MDTEDKPWSSGRARTLSLPFISFLSNELIFRSITDDQALAAIKSFKRQPELQQISYQKFQFYLSI